MAELTHPSTIFNGKTMGFMAPPDGKYFPGGSSSATGATGSAMKRAKVMRTTPTSIATTATYPEYGGKATDPRHYHHGETTGFTPVTAVVAEGNVAMHGYEHNDHIVAGTVLDAKYLTIPAETNRRGRKEVPLSEASMPMVLVSDAVCATKGKFVRASFTVAVEGRALVNRRFLADDCNQWKVGDKLFWRPPQSNTQYAHPKNKLIPWTLHRIADGSCPHYHAILFNELVGTSAGSGYILAFIVAFP